MTVSFTSANRESLSFRLLFIVVIILKLKYGDRSALPLLLSEVTKRKVITLS